MSFINNQEQATQLFNLIPDWCEKYNFLIELGQSLPQYPEILKTQQNRIGSCVSTTFFLCTVTNAKILINGYSNAAIPAGLIALLKQICDGHTPAAVNRNISIHTKTGLIDNLTGFRKNGFEEMINKIYICTANE